MNVKELLNLKNKVILVTGGAGLYGKCIVEGLAEAGGTVIIASRNIAHVEEVADRFRQNNLDVHAMQVDQGDHSSILALKNEIENRFGRLDVFVNNAVARPMKGYDDPVENIAVSMQINATGSMDILREMCDLIARSGGGSVINISSMMGMYGPDLSNYEGTSMGNPPPDYFFHRGGLINLTRYLARILADKKIRVNCVSLGGLLDNQPESFLEAYRGFCLNKGMLNPDDVVGTIRFLLSDEARFMNGQNLVVDDGFTL